MKNFWEQLKKPFFVLAPMEEVTDTVMRQMIASCGRPDVFFTEFTNVDGILSKGAEHVSRRLKFTQAEHPLVAQIWGNNPEKFFEVARIISKMGFDGIDINMGCPDKSVIKKGCCSGLIKNPEMALKIIDAVKKGASDLPVSVKTRLGFSEIETETWIKFLLEQNLSVLTLHLRTVREMSKVPAHWDEMKKIIQLRKKIKSKTLIIGNGDILSKKEGLSKIREFGLDGIMMGKAIFQNPWVFDPKANPTKEEKLKTLLKHAELFVKTWGDKKNFVSLRKFFKAYVNGFEGASDLRAKLVLTNSISEVKEILALEKGLD